MLVGATLEVFRLRLMVKLLVECDEAEMETSGAGFYRHIMAKKQKGKGNGRKKAEIGDNTHRTRQD
jgi:hypothetical protein